jgi:CheY-like chemotaxis protein
MSEPFAGRRVLVVEDEYLIAADVVRLLRRLGADVVGPVAQVEHALALIEADKADCAILDINLGDEDIFRVADALERRGKPYVFATGYPRWAIPDRYRDVVRLGKPLQPDQLAAAASGLGGM